HGESGAERPAPLGLRTAARRSVDSGRNSVVTASQQQADWPRPAQQALVALLALFAEQADASPATDSIPRTAARTSEGRRKSQRRTVMAATRPKLPKLPQELLYHPGRS